MSSFDEHYKARRDTVPTETIAFALEIIASDIRDDEGTTRGALHEAAERLRKLEAENERLRGQFVDPNKMVFGGEKEVQP